MQFAGILAVNSLRHRVGNPAGSGSSQRCAELPAELEGFPVYDFHVELARESGETVDFTPLASGDIASYFCTGGTTGLPKNSYPYAP